MSEALPAMIVPLPAVTKDDVDNDARARARLALDVTARSIGRATVDHLKEMYPAALAAVTQNAERSLTNFVRNRINRAAWPMFERLMANREHIASLKIEERELVRHLRGELRQRDADIRELKRVIEELRGGEGRCDPRHGS